MSTIRKTFYALLVTVVALVALEFGLRALEPDVAGVSAAPGGWQAKFFARFLGWHEPDPDLLWRHRANLRNPLLTTNSLGLLGPEISPHKSARTRRILLLGDSTPVGIGLKRRADAFGERLTALLNELNPEFEWELINAAVSGYSSAQVARAAPRLISEYQPDVIVVHAGANDASLSGAQSDRAALAARGSSLARTALKNLALARTLARLLGATQVADISQPLQVRATPAEFAENISSIIALAEQSQTPLILIKPAAPRLWPAGLQYKVFRHFSDSLGEPLMPPRLRELLGAELLYCFSAEMRAALYPELDEFTERALAAQFADSLSVDDALVTFRSAVAADSADFVAINNLGVTLWKAGVYDSSLVWLYRASDCFKRFYSTGASEIENSAVGSALLYNIGVCEYSRAWPGGAFAPNLALETPRAAVYLDSALQSDYFSLRVKRAYTQAIDSLGALNDGAVRLVDADAILRQHSGEALFVDHCHPNETGHVLLARTLYYVVVDVMARAGSVLQPNI